MSRLTFAQAGKRFPLILPLVALAASLVALVALVDCRAALVDCRASRQLLLRLLAWWTLPLGWGVSALRGRRVAFALAMPVAAELGKMVDRKQWNSCFCVLLLVLSGAVGTANATPQGQLREGNSAWDRVQPVGIQRVWEMTCNDGQTHSGTSIDAILANRPSYDKCTVQLRRSTGRSLIFERTEPLELQLAQPGAETCDLCAHEWVFILSTGRAGSTSIMEALNALPNVKISGENQASLEAATELLSRHLEHIDREMVVQNASTNAAMAHGNVDKKALLCNLQRWFVELSGTKSEAHGRTRTRA